MKVEEACRRVIKEPYNAVCVDDENLFAFFDLNFYELDINYTALNEGLKGYYVRAWYCTDTFVGLIAIYLHDEFVGFSYQKGRKCSVDYFFVSKELQDKTKQFILDCCSLKEQKEDFVKSCSFEEELEDGFEVYFDALLPNITKSIKVDGKILSIKEVKNKSVITEEGNIIKDEILYIMNNVV